MLGINSWRAWLPLLLAALAASVACGGGGESTATPAPHLRTDYGVTDSEIRIGAHLPLSGPAGGLLTPYIAAMQAYLTKVNQEDGGVCGRKIVYIAEDDQYSPVLAREAARKLIETDKVLALAGGWGGPNNAGSADYVNDPNGDGDPSDGVPTLFLVTGAGTLVGPKRPWSVLFFPPYFDEGKILANYANANLAGKTVGFLYQNDDTGKDAIAGFKQAYRGRVVAEQPYEATAVDITSQMANLRSANPDVLFILATPPQAARAYAYMQLNNWRPQVILSQSTLPSLLASVLGGGDVARGYQQMAGAITTQFLLDARVDASAPAMMEHKRIMNSYGGPAPNLNTVTAQTVGELLVEVLRRACERGDLTRAGVREAALSLQHFRTSLLDEGIEVTLGPSDPLAIQALRLVQINPDGTFRRLTGAIGTD